MPIPDDLSAINQTPFSDALSKIEELLIQSGRVFLIGAGCSKCAGLPLMSELTEKVLGVVTIDETTKAILGSIRDIFGGATNANIEDYLSELIDLLAIAERREMRGATQKAITVGNTTYDVLALRKATEQIKQSIAEVIDKKVSIETHRSFIKAIHRPIRPGKSIQGQIVDYLVLNYDTVLEDALALERIPFSDGIDGGVSGWWNPDTFDRNGLAARVFKLHGSINWCEIRDDSLPRRIASCVQVESVGDRHVMIWPASTKYRESQLDPYAQIAERSRQALRPSRGDQRFLIVCGYQFGDPHINFEIDRALRESEGDLTLLVFTSENEPSGQLEKWRQDLTITDQILIYANRGFFHGDQAISSAEDLLWWKFENVVRLIGGER